MLPAVAVCALPLAQVRWPRGLPSAPEVVLVVAHRTAKELVSRLGAVTAAHVTPVDPRRHPEPRPRLADCQARRTTLEAGQLLFTSKLIDVSRVVSRGAPAGGSDLSENVSHLGGAPVTECRRLGIIVVVVVVELYSEYI